MVDTTTVRITRPDKERIKELTDDSRDWKGRMQELVDMAERYTEEHNDA